MLYSQSTTEYGYIRAILIQEYTITTMYDLLVMIFSPDFMKLLFSLLKKDCGY